MSKRRRLQLLLALADEVREYFRCCDIRDDGGDWKPGDDGFEEHAYDAPWSDVQGCLHCMAVAALAETGAAKDVQP